MGFIVGAYVSPAALAAVALGVVLALRIPWWAALAVTAACAALAVTAVLSLMRLTERRAAQVTARWAVQQRLRAEVTGPVTPPRRVTAGGGVTINMINPTPAQQAEVIRAITEGSGPDGGTSPAAVRPVS
jgi:hypothetical protein